jgi:hypothetical protein
MCAGNKLGSVPLREKRRLMVFENKMVARIFGPMREEVIGRVRKLHSFIT